jgi:paraquat-inducible protein B
VKSDSRFWEAGGIDVALGTDGVKINTQSLVSILIGGLAFETPAASLAQPEAQARTPFTLFATRAEAMKVQDRIVDTYVLNFKESVRGLTVGAPVDFRGIVLGEVAAIYTRFDPVTKQISIPVEIKFYPERFTSRYATGKPEDGRVMRDPKTIADFLVSRGFRGQLKTGSLLTGQLYVSFDFFPRAPKATVDWNRTPAELPTEPSGLQSLQESINRIVARIDKLPIEQIGKNTQQALADAGTLMQSLNTQVVPQAKSTLSAAQATLNSANSALAPDSTLQQDTSDAIRELARTAASFRALSDYLQRHPEALLRGKQEDAK